MPAAAQAPAGRRKGTRRAPAARRGCSPAAPAESDRGERRWRRAPTSERWASRQAIEARLRPGRHFASARVADVDGRAQPDEASGRAKEIEHANDFDLCRRGICFSSCLRRVARSRTPRSSRRRRRRGRLHTATRSSPGRTRNSRARIPQPTATYQQPHGRSDRAIRPRRADCRPQRPPRRRAGRWPSRVRSPFSARTTCPAARTTATRSTASARSRARRTPTASRRTPASMGLCVPQMPQAAPAH